MSAGSTLRAVTVLSRVYKSRPGRGGRSVEFIEGRIPPPSLFVKEHQRNE